MLHFCFTPIFAKWGLATAIILAAVAYNNLGLAFFKKGSFIMNEKVPVSRVRHLLSLIEWILAADERTALDT